MDSVHTYTFSCKPVLVLSSQKFFSWVVFLLQCCKRHVLQLATMAILSGEILDPLAAVFCVAQSRSAHPEVTVVSSIFLSPELCKPHDNLLL